MTLIGIAQFVAFVVILLAITKPLGSFMARLFAGEQTFLHALLRPVEKLIYVVGGVKEDVEQKWTQYAASLLSFSLFGFLFVYVIQRMQGWLPFNPQHFGTATAPANATPMTPDLAFNTAVSFMTNTNWQSYVPETTLSYFTQMAALTVQNFVSAAVGIAVAIAVTRGFARQTVKTIGNFWVDMTRATLYLLLPLSIAGALLLCWQGVIQNFQPYEAVQTVEGATQTIGQGPVASQEAIKMIGTNGGGFFNANSAHPYENPTPLSNMFQMLMIFCIPAGLTYTFGKMVRDTRQGWALLATMALMFAAGFFILYWAEQAGNPTVAAFGVESQYTGMQSGGNMEGKEVRFGNPITALFATITTDASCGAVIGMHDSFTPLGGLVPIFNIMTDEVIFGGVGAGLYSMLLYVIVAVFIGGLMVGRTPEYVGKKIEQKEVKMAILAILATSFCILVFSGITSVVGTGSLNNGGPHGFSEILYAFSSASGNNGSAFAGINANTPWYSITLGLAMLVARFLFIIPVLAIAGSLAGKKVIPVTNGTLPTHGALFVTLLIGTVVIVGALTYFPALSLGPIVEHFQMLNGKAF